MIATNVEEALLNLFHTCQRAARTFSICAEYSRIAPLRAALAARSQHCRQVAGGLRPFLAPSRTRNAAWRRPSGRPCRPMPAMPMCCACTKCAKAMSSPATATSSTSACRPRCRRCCCRSSSWRCASTSTSWPSARRCAGDRVRCGVNRPASPHALTAFAARRPRTSRARLGRHCPCKACGRPSKPDARTCSVGRQRARSMSIDGHRRCCPPLRRLRASRARRPIGPPVRRWDCRAAARRAEMAKQQHQNPAQGTSSTSKRSDAGQARGGPEPTRAWTRPTAPDTCRPPIRCTAPTRRWGADGADERGDRPAARRRRQRPIGPRACAGKRRTTARAVSARAPGRAHRASRSTHLPRASRTDSAASRVASR
jgi:hypothetical protein